jgi:hypothetical protein
MARQVSAQLQSHPPANYALCHRLFSTHRSMSARQALQILGMPASTAFVDIQRHFLQLALQHHPDRPGGNIETFVSIRQAFEYLRETQSGKSDNLHRDSEGGINVDKWTEEDYDDWFYRETGHHWMGFALDAATQKEIVNAYETLSPGGRDPGEWELARQVTERANKSGKSGSDALLALEAGDNVQTTSKRRRRKW